VVNVSVSPGLKLQLRFVPLWLMLCALGLFIIPLSAFFVTSTNASPGPVQRAVCAVLAVMTLWLTVRIARCALLTTPQGLFGRRVTTHDSRPAFLETGNGGDRT
jgi:hypothetical protein